MSPKVQIILMSRNRADYISQTIHSILKQSYKNIDFVISDNSTNNLTESIIQQNFPTLQYIKRTTDMTMVAHWNKILEEINAPYFMMFHDDDVMHKDCVSNLVSGLEMNKNLVAISGNAKIIKNGRLTAELHNKKLSTAIQFTTIEDFGRRYFDSELGGVNPFPSYMYRTEMVKNLRFNTRDAGKHSDVAFLFKALSIGAIEWIPDITIDYRIHGSNISVGIDILSLSRLVRIYCRNIPSTAHKSGTLAKEFIIKNYILWLKQVGLREIKKEHPARLKIIVFSIVKYFLFSPLRFVRIIIRQFSK